MAGAESASSATVATATRATPEEERVDPVERGQTRIADRVVAKVASQAAREALRAGPGARALPAGRRFAPRATVSVQDDRARVRVTVDLGYPSDIGTQCADVRRQVALRVSELTGMEVRDVAVSVERLHSPYLDGEGLGRVR